ncbi:HAMP domain-containing protein [Phycicoccus sp. MAQZ13P-2]|uniref:sensor histidine kinase n=1 Tax=Phycicoccus mangrovi TaxID=2840470 RepID=UPI001BFFEB86|nr:ATP-binding protein [Phycicoccus mangrovi]MBT9257155.1 HAMP domain-containing protein [Phycicoccus mangrovi]MBT9276346.1 HAMP domain-containing protein [Phycicoccus mangrovi]
MISERRAGWRWASWSMRRRVVTASAIGLTLLFALSVAAFTLTLDSLLTQAAQGAARTQAAQLAAVIQAGEYTPQAAVTQLPAQGSIIQARDAAGVILASSDPSVSTTPLSTGIPPVGKVIEAEVDRLGDEIEPFVVVSRRAAIRSGAPVVISVAVPLAVESRTLGLATFMLSAGSAVIVAVMLLVIGKVVTTALRPVATITAEVGAITAARTAERVTVPPSADEVATLAQTMNDMLDRLSRADAVTRRFVSDASHELRSPLATLRAHIETAPPGPDGAVVDRELLVAEVERLHRLVADLLVLARADDHGLHLRLDEVDVDDLVDQEVRRLRAISSSPVFATVVAAQVRGDIGRLEQVLRNLTDNAIRHSTGWVRVSMDLDEPGWVRVHVDNAGRPVPMDLREAVFDRFRRLDDARTRDAGGSGLGLSIAATFASAHGGTVSAGETADGDCRFSLRLPRLD